MSTWTRTRTVTVLFVDLVGSTERLTSLAPSTADAVRDAHLRILRDAVQRAGGREVKNLGDGLMAAFDSGRAAVHAAEEMQRGLQRHARHAVRTALQARIGIATGDATHGDGDWFGAPVIAASRLCTAAAPEQILVSAAVEACVGPEPGPVLAEVGPLALKGLPRPLLAWEVRWSPVPVGLRVVVADDDALLREGLARLLTELGFDVVARAADAHELDAQVDRLRPDVVLTDVRMPPTHTTEGFDAARRIRDRHPRIGIILLSQHIEAHYAHELARSDPRGIGCLRKQCVTDVTQLVAAVRRVAAGEVLMDAE